LGGGGRRTLTFEANLGKVSETLPQKQNVYKKFQGITVQMILANFRFCV
jgi:hypothetical protein